MYPKTLISKLLVNEHLLVSRTAMSAAEFEYEIRCQLAEKMVPELVKIIDVQKIQNPTVSNVEFYGELIAMSRDEFVANYANNQQRRGIADGTMAIMQNGSWKVISNNSPSYPTYFAPKPTPKVTKPKVVDPTEYLRNRVSEIQNAKFNP